MYGQGEQENSKASVTGLYHVIQARFYSNQVSWLNPVQAHQTHSSFDYWLHYNGTARDIDDNL